MKHKKSLLIICLIICLFSIASVCASDVNDTIVANDDGTVLDESSPETFTDLANKLNSSENEIILENDYIYDSSIDSDYQNGIEISKTITLDGKGHIIDGNGGAKLLKVYGSGVILKNIIFTNSFSSSLKKDASVIFNSKNGVLENCSFINISVKYGISALSVCDATLNNCYFANNFVKNDGKTIDCSGNTILTNCKFINNTAKYGSLYLTGTSKIYHCDFVNNNGGAMTTIDSYMNLTDCSFINNSADFGEYGEGGALVLGRNSHGILNNCSFINNFALQRGGAIYLVGDEWFLSNCTFINNKVKESISWGNGDGGAIIWYGNVGTLENSVFINNSASKYSGAISWVGAEGILKNSVFINNTARESGAISWVGEDGYINTCTFINNTPTNSYDASVNVIKKQLNMNCSNYSFYYNYVGDVSINIIGDIPVYSSIFFNVSNGNDSKCFTVNLKNNIAQLSKELSDLHVGDWTVTAKFEGDDNYYPCNSTFLVSINPISSNLSLDKINGSYCKQINLAAHVLDHFNSTINEGTIVFFDGETQIGESKVSNGIATLEYVPMAVGDYLITAKFTSDNYCSSNKTVTISVLPSVSSVTVDDCNGSWQSETTITAHVNDGNIPINEGVVVFYVSYDSIDYEPTDYESLRYELLGFSRVIDGIANFIYEPTGTPGKHIIYAIFEPSNNYLKSNNTARLLVDSGDIDVSKYESVATFKELSNLIKKTPKDGNITLNKDYIYVSGSTDGISIDKPITIDGQGHTIDGNAKSKLLKVTGSNVVLKNFVFTNSYSDSTHLASAVSLGGNGVLDNCTFMNINVKYGYSALSTSNSIIKNCYFLNNHARDGSTVELSSSVDVINCKFINNTGGRGGGIRTTGIQNNIINCEFINNSDAISIFWSSQNNIINCSFIDNVGLGVSAIGVSGVANTIENCSFINNEGASIVSFASSPSSDDSKLINCYFVNNTSIDDSTTNGIVNLRAFDCLVCNCSFINNTAKNSKTYSTSASAICMQGSDGIVTNCFFSDNYAERGSAIYWTGETGSMSNCLFINNVASNYAGAIYWTGKDGYVNNCTFINNTPDNSYGDSVNVIKKQLNMDYTNYSFNYNYVNNVSIGLINVLDDVPVNSPIIFNIINGNDRKSFTINLKNNIAQISNELSDLYVGVWTVTAMFDGDDNYYPCNATFTITVNPASSFLSIEDINTTSRQETSIIAHILDSNNLPINEGNVTFFDGKSNIGNANVINGIARLNYAPLYGEHTFSAVYLGNNYLSSKNNLTVFIDRKEVVITSSNITTVYNSNQSLIVNVRDVNGLVVSTLLFIAFDNNEGLYSTDENGQIEVSTKGFIAKSYSFDISICDDRYYASNVTGYIVVNKAPTTLTSSSVTTVYNGDKYLVVTLKDTQANPIKGSTISINLNGVKKLTTDSIGQVKLTTNGLSPKTYTTTIVFGGDDNYVGSSVTVKVTVTKATPKLTASAKTFKVSVKTKQYTVTLKDNKNKVMNKAKVTIKVNGKTFSATTNSKGQATFKITNLNKKATFKATVTYAATSCYNKVTKNVKITVK